MANAKHSNQTPDDGIHIPYAWTFSNATTRAAGTVTDGPAVTVDDIGKLGRQLDDDSLWMLTGFGPLVWVALAGSGSGGVFGNDYAIAQSNTRSTTTSTVFQTKTTMTTPTLTGTYRIGWAAVADQSSIADAVEVRLRDTTNSVTLNNNDDAVHQEPKDVDNRLNVGTFLVRAFAAESITMEIQYRQQHGSTAGISNARIEIWKVGA